MLRKLGKDVVLYGSADFIFRLTQFLIVPFYAHLLSVADFGMMALLTVSASLLGMLGNLGINNSVQRYYFDPETREQDRPMIVSTGLAQLLVSGLFTVGAAFVILQGVKAQLLTAYAIPWPLVIIVLLTVLPDQISQYTLDTARLHFAPLKFCAIALVKNLLAVLLGVWLLVGWGMGVRGVLLGTLLSAVAAVPLGLIAIRRDLTLRIDIAVARRLFRYAYPFVFVGAAYWIFGSMDRWMLAELGTVEDVGLFSIALKFAAIISFLISAFAQAWSPFAFRMAGEDNNYRENIARVFSLWFCLLALMGLGLSLFARELIMALTPASYWGAASILSIATGGIVLYGTVQVTALGITLEKRTLLLTYGAWIAAAANVALNLFLIPRLGAAGAALATFFSYLILTSVFLFWSQRLHPIPLERRKLAYCCLIVALTVAVAFARPEPGLMAIAIKLFVLLAACGGAAAVGIGRGNLPWELLATEFTEAGLGHPSRNGP